jgi:hypothetical protein
MEIGQAFCEALNCHTSAVRFTEEIFDRLGFNELFKQKMKADFDAPPESFALSKKPWRGNVVLLAKNINFREVIKFPPSKKTAEDIRTVPIAVYEEGQGGAAFLGLDKAKFCGCLLSVLCNQTE